MKILKFSLLILLRLHELPFVLSHDPDHHHHPTIFEQFYRNDYTFIDRFDGFYKWHEERLTFFDAVEVCDKEGAVLWIPESRKEIYAVFEFVSPKRDLLWIGLHDRLAQGTYAPIDGRPQSELFLNWAENEPNDDRRDSCVVVDRNTKYYNGRCNAKKTFVCMIDVEKLPLNVECETYDPRYRYNDDLDHCYKFHTDKRDWHDAFRICRAEGGNLLILNSNREASYIENLIGRRLSNLPTESTPIYTYAGFNDILQEGTFMTVEGELISDTGYTLWSEGQPDDANNNEDCGSVSTTASLYDADCGTPRYFICEKKFD